MWRRFLRWFSPRVFDDGLERCNRLGMEMAGKRVRRMLDLGCGNGEFTRRFAEAVGAKEIYGIEFIEETARQARRKGIKVKRRDLNKKWKLGKERFDLVLSSQNIEHMHDTRLYLEEAYFYLRKGGRLIVLTENLASWVNIFALLWGWQPFSVTCIDGFNLGNPLTWHTEEKKDEAFLDRYHDSGVTGTVGHVRVLAYRGLKEILAKVGFRKVEVQSRGYLPLAGGLSDALCKIDPRHGNFLIATGVK